LCGIVGPVVGTALFAYFTRDSAPVKIPGIAFFMAAALNAVALAVSYRALSHPRAMPSRATEAAL
jgi:DHA1 family tetracycline resistance protein-like MFS transporter